MNGLDEIDLSGETRAYEVKKGKITLKRINPQKLEFKKISLQAIKGGDISKNVQIMIEILAGKKSTARDIVVLNSAYALSVAGRVKTIPQGIKLAESVIDNGSAKKVLDNLRKETQKYA